MKNNVKTRKKRKFKLSKKEIVIASIIFLLLIVFIVVIANGKDSLNDDDKNLDVDVIDEFRNNVNPGVIDDKEQDGLKFTNTALACSKTSSQLTTLVQNMTSSDIEVRIFDIIVKDKDGKIIVQLQGYVGGEVPFGETREIVSNVDMDLINATSVEYKLVR